MLTWSSLNSLTFHMSFRCSSNFRNRSNLSRKSSKMLFKKTSSDWQIISSAWFVLVSMLWSSSSSFIRGKMDVVATGFVFAFISSISRLYLESWYSDHVRLRSLVNTLLITRASGLQNSTSARAPLTFSRVPPGFAITHFFALHPINKLNPRRTNDWAI